MAVAVRLDVMQMSGPPMIFGPKFGRFSQQDAWCTLVPSQVQQRDLHNAPHSYPLNRRPSSGGRSYFLTGYDPLVGSGDSGPHSIQLQSLARTKEMFVPMFPKSNVIRGICDLSIIFPGWYLGDIICLFLTLPVQFGIGRRFYRPGFKSLRHGNATWMSWPSSYQLCIPLSLLSLLVTPHLIASGSLPSTYHPSIFFDTCTMLITFFCLGRYLENLAKGKTSAALSKLISLCPPSATLYLDPPHCTQERQLPTELIEVGDILKIIPGDKIPADGSLVSGESSIDESMVTGEAMAVSKTVGDQVIGGTVNGFGTFNMLVSRAGSDTALSQIVKLVEEAQTSKAPIQALPIQLLEFCTHRPCAWSVDVCRMDDHLTHKLGQLHPPLKRLFVTSPPQMETAVANWNVDDGSIGSGQYQWAPHLAGATADPENDKLKKDILMALTATDRSTKTGGKQAVEAFRKMGMSVIMVTGDHRRTALAIASQVGIPSQDVLRISSPEGKESSSNE
ncbi:hypothetical protein KEM48_001336 [Puccinia striiformis f. sp. tritici PST-130]|nr:hypothetical protein KEM48_001336 [Puccinia striiformis f. sp. tritici PST-130]